MNRNVLIALIIGVAIVAAAAIIGVSMMNSHDVVVINNSTNSTNGTNSTNVTSVNSTDGSSEASQTESSSEATYPNGKSASQVEAECKADVNYGSPSYDINVAREMHGAVPHDCP